MVTVNIQGSIITEGTFIETNPVNSGQGLERLLSTSMREAFHDSSARWPPPRCHFGTRQELIAMITDWGLGISEHHQHILWMYGPFGVGKTAIAQTCAEILASKRRLGASLFFSRPNNQNDPSRVFTSIAYQIAVQCQPFADILDRKIQTNQALVTASLPVQFQELLVEPLGQVLPACPELEGYTLVIDGLDECKGVDAQCEIINITSSSVRDGTTPFRWFFTSRPEVHIVGSMNANPVSPLLFRFELPLSPKMDHEILTYFVYELNRIGERHGVSSSWPSEADVAVLVELAAGLWVYAATVVRFISDPVALGPVDQLRLVLSLKDNIKRRESDSVNPLAQMDLFYHLMFHQLTPKNVMIMRKILLLNSVYYEEFDKVHEMANVLGLSKEQFRTACGFLSSVLHFDLAGSNIQFYHASFMEFMEDRRRSQALFIYGDSLTELQQEIIERLNAVHACSTTTPTVDATYPQPSPHVNDNLLGYRGLVYSLVVLCDSDKCVVSPSVASSLVDFQFSKIPQLLSNCSYAPLGLNHTRFRNNLPPQFRGKILRRTWNPFHHLRKPEYASSDRPFILGHGANRLVCWLTKSSRNYLPLVQTNARINGGEVEGDDREQEVPTLSEA